MTNAEKIELALLPACGATLWLLAPAAPVQIGGGGLLLGASGLLLAQGLLRDLWLLFKARRTPGSGPRPPARCMCVESTLGVSGVLTGIVASGAGFAPAVALERGALGLLAVGIMAVGFALKDYVVGWAPWRLYREKDHASLVFSWKGEALAAGAVQKPSAEGRPKGGLGRV